MFTKGGASPLRTTCHRLFHNKTNTPSPEMEAIYLYTGDGWSYKQVRQECHSTASAVQNYSLRHFLKPPVRRLQGGSWAQVKIIGKKILAIVPRDKQKEKYRISGHLLVKIATGDGTFEYPINADIELDEIPF
jgi:hypothetical protein